MKLQKKKNCIPQGPYPLKLSKKHLLHNQNKTTYCNTEVKEVKEKSVSGAFKYRIVIPINLSIPNFT